MVMVVVMMMTTATKKKYYNNLLIMIKEKITDLSKLSVNLSLVHFFFLV